MKKILSICLFAFMAIGFTSCEVSEPCKFHKAYIDFKVPSGAWSFDATNQWFYYRYETSILTQSVYDLGTWTMSHEYNHGAKNAYLIQLPEFRFMETLVSGSIYRYIQRVDYEVGIGYVTVYVVNSDYIYDPGWRPDEMYFHMQVVY